MKLKIKMIALLVVFLLQFAESSAWPIRGKRRWVPDSSSSGTLYCTASGTCAEVIGDMIFFGNLVGHWSYGYISQPPEDDESNNQEYYIDHVEEVQ